MTVINNIEIDDIQYHRNIIKEAIINNETVEDKLHVVIVVSNPCLFARRYILAREFIQRMELEESDIHLYVVELTYGNQRFLVTDSKNPRHLQIRTKIPIWHKENMVNLGIRKLLPANWKAVAWIDADIEFENTTWAKDTMKILNGTKDVVQIFSHCVDMNQHGEAMNIFSSFGNQFVKGIPYTTNQINYWHPGYAWACTRKAYEKMGGLYESAILGSADNIMSLSFINRGLRAINENSSDDYKKTVIDFQNRVKNLRLGYVPGVIRHHFHGSKKNRKYTDRWQILLKHDYAPSKHITKDENGILIPTKSCPSKMLDEIKAYFKERNEDEFYEKKIAASNFLPDPIKVVEDVQTTIEIEASVSDEPIENTESYKLEGEIERIEDIEPPKSTSFYKSFISLFYGNSV
jgi:hypothetical protein